MIMQKLGGTVTVTTEYGGLYRIDPENLDAIGMEVPAASPAAAGTAGTAGEARSRSTTGSGTSCAAATTRRFRSISSSSGWSTAACSTLPPPTAARSPRSR